MTFFSISHCAHPLFHLLLLFLDLQPIIEEEDTTNYKRGKRPILFDLSQYAHVSNVSITILSRSLFSSKHPIWLKQTWKHIQIFRSLSMGKARGVNNGVNQSSLDYLFGSGESPSAVAATMGTTTTTTTTTTTDGTGGRPVTTTTTTVTENKKIPAGVRGSPNNYFRSEGQNCGNFLTVKGIDFVTFSDWKIESFYLETDKKAKNVCVLLLVDNRRGRLLRFMLLLVEDLLLAISLVDQVLLLNLQRNEVCFVWLSDL